MNVMKNIWGSDNIASCVKFFAESVLELTNNYSAASHRHRTLSTVLKAAELKEAILEVRKRVVKKPHLTPMVEEYIDAITSDPIISFMLDKRGLSEDVLKFKLEDSTEKIYAKVTIFLDLFSKNYGDSAVNLIKSTCESTAREKEKIRKCADNYISHLINQGYSREYIHISAKRRFSLRDMNGNESDELSQFFHYFKGVRKKYDVLINCKADAGKKLAQSANAQFF